MSGKKQVSYELLHHLPTYDFLDRAVDHTLFINEYDIDLKNARRLGVGGPTDREKAEAEVKRAELDYITTTVLADRTGEITKLVMGPRGETTFYGFNIIFSSVLSRIPFEDKDLRE